MNPTTGRPWKVCAPAVGVPVAMSVVTEVVSDTSPVVEAFAPLKCTAAQPAWKVDVTVTVVTFCEPRTSEGAAGVDGALVEPLRKDSTVDSQHSEFAGAPGGVGEKSLPVVPAVRSSRLKNTRSITSHAPLAVSTLVNGAIAVPALTNRRLVGNVMTQSVLERVAASRMYSFRTSECIIVADAALAPPPTVRPAARPSARAPVYSKLRKSTPPEGIAGLVHDTSFVTRRPAAAVSVDAGITAPVHMSLGER